MKKLLTGALLLLPAFLNADTINLKDGTSQNGQLVSANGRQIVFLDDTNRRRTYNVIDVESLQFGSGYRNRSADSMNRSADSMNRSADLNVPSSTVSNDRADMIDRLRDDVRSALSRTSNLTSDERTRLEQAARVFDSTSRNVRNGQADSMDRDDIRTAIQEVRDIAGAGNMRPTDKQKIESDLNTMRDLRRNANGSRDYDRTR